MWWLWVGWTVVGCGPQVPAAPLVVQTPWAPTRSDLPETTLRIVHTFTVQARESAQAHGGRHALRRGPVSAFVLEHPTAGLVLVDTGYGRRTVEGAHDYPGSMAVWLLGLTPGPDGPVADRLADIGYAPDDVRHVFITHLHHDHAGGIEDFREAEVWVDAREWAVGTDHSRLRGYSPAPYAERTAREVRFEGTATYGPFEGHVDAFEDGSVILLPAPGHTPGSMMVLFNLPDGSWLYTGDAAWVELNWQVPTPKGALARRFVEDDWQLAMDTLWRLNAWSGWDEAPRIIAGHEPKNLQLPAWPEPF